jgi:hypothetical protein
MNQEEIHKLLEAPKAFSKASSRYLMENGKMLLYLGYDDSLVLAYMHIGLPLN